ncbi:MAG: hypothetical protein J5656_06955 [Clostridia bacterium]|nr:hypothetical protein [Clostridia bacterium]
MALILSNKSASYNISQVNLPSVSVSAHQHSQQTYTYTGSGNIIGVAETSTETPTTCGVANVSINNNVITYDLVNYTAYAVGAVGILKLIIA